jgi:hypothetical protein
MSKLATRIFDEIQEEMKIDEAFVMHRSGVVELLVCFFTYLGQLNARIL